MISDTAAKAELLRSLHVPGDPLILPNVWDAVTARTVAAAAGVRAIATASHAISFARGVPDGEGLTVDQALEAAGIVTHAVDLPVSVDFERGYSADLGGLQDNIVRLIESGAAGLNFEDSTGDDSAPLVPLADQVERIAAIRSVANAARVPIVINARADALARGSEWPELVERANAYLAAGADVIFVLGLSTEDLVSRAVAEIGGKISVISRPGSVPLKRLAELGVSRVSFGPYLMGLTLSHLQTAATQLVARGEYPEELGFSF